LLDLDGTLVNSVPDLAAALNAVMAGAGLAAFAEAEVAALVGDGVDVLLGRAFAARAHPQGPEAKALFMATYAAHVADATRPYPGVPEGLAALAGAGWRLAICTNKPEALARRIVADLGLADRFAAIGGGDSFPTRKPDPAHLLATLAQAGGTPDAAVMVGDHANDVAAATAAGVPCIFAGWGYGSPAMAQGAAAIATRFADIPDLAASLLP